MKIQNLSTMSGLTRGQIDQLISRHGIELHSKPPAGAARNFTPADSFLISLAGELHRVGLRNKEIASAVASIIPEVDPNTFRQTEIYPGRASLEAAGEPVFAIIVKGKDGNTVTEFSRQSDLYRKLGEIGAGTGIVVSASLIANTIEQLEKGEGANDV